MVRKLLFNLFYNLAIHSQKKTLWYIKMANKFKNGR